MYNYEFRLQLISPTLLYMFAKLNLPYNEYIIKVKTYRENTEGIKLTLNRLAFSMNIWQ